MTDIEQDLRETARRVASAYASVRPDEALLRSVIEHLLRDPRQAAPKRSHPNIESPYKRFFAFNAEWKYLIPAALCLLLVVSVDLRHTALERSPLARTSDPLAIPAAMMERNATPALMTAEAPATEDAAGTRAFAPSAKTMSISSVPANRIEVGDSGITLTYPSPCAPFLADVEGSQGGSIATYIFACSPEGTGSNVIQDVAFYTLSSLKAAGANGGKTEQQSFIEKRFISDQKIIDDHADPYPFETTNVGGTEYVIEPRPNGFTAWVTYIGDIRIEVIGWGDEETLLKELSFFPQ